MPQHSIFHAARRALLTILSSAALIPAALPAQIDPRGWFVAREQDSGRVQLSLSERPDNGGDEVIAVELPIAELRGLMRGVANAASVPVRYALVREAGTITFDGATLGRGEIRGAYSFAVSSRFVAELVRRGFSRPADADQLRLALGDVGTPLIDELNAQGFAQPTIPQLARAGLHGVDVAFARGIADAGIRLRDIQDLARFRDHGVTPEYIADMRRAGYADIAPAELVRLKDHGVDPVYLSQLAAAGYNGVSPDDVMRARSHGVDAGFVFNFSRAGFTNLSLPDLILLRDHGIDVGFAKRLRDRMKAQPTVDDLVQAKSQSERGEGTAQGRRSRRGRVSSSATSSSKRIFPSAFTPRNQRTLKSYGCIIT